MRLFHCSKEQNMAVFALLVLIFFTEWFMIALKYADCGRSYAAPQPE